MSTKISCKKLSRIESDVRHEMDVLFGGTLGFGTSPTREEAAKNGREYHRMLFTDFNEYVDFLYLIREVKRKFNEDKGINVMTLDIAKLEMKKTFLEKSIPSPSLSRRYGSNDPTYYHDGLDEHSKVEVRALIRGVNREIQSIKDRCNAVNSKPDVELPEDLFKFLQQNKFI